ncbi:ATP-binding protein [Mangrovimonas sp. CR14]|uniref:AAA family ATPase n=1 Tax=Mangrovimonas sp. CR14 TaxID=2706120 RepID=UPI00141D9E00|nr:ATP-binding protein [Mangrovimonas sp. CR14]NIK93234.1 ATP-binding protein [Mangrovimonas sp. CR14]
MKLKKIVITGGPGTGKTSLINELEKRGYPCLEEVSRQIILNARKDGVDQLFLTEPLLFSERLMEGRKKQFQEAETHGAPVVFIDRGIPDVLAYMDYAKETYPSHFIQACEIMQYDKVFVLAPWESIYLSDNERYESFEQAVEIHDYLEATYQRFGYDLENIPFDTIEKRADYLISLLM